MTPRPALPTITELRTAAPADQRAIAETLVRNSRDLETLRAALAVLADAQDPALRPLLHETYARCEGAASRRDSSGFIRAAVVRALTPIIHPDDEALLLRALTTYQMQGLYELCAELRAAALQAMQHLDPGTAALFAARFLTDPRTSFSGEPALTAIRLLAQQHRLEPLFALASWETANGQLIGEALRNLVDLPAPLVELLIEHHRATEDAQVAVGLLDLLLGHHERHRWHAFLLEDFLPGRDLDIYGIAVTTMVASRDAKLIEALRARSATERDPQRRSLLEHALELA